MILARSDELLLSEESSPAKKRAEFNSQVAERVWWGLFDGMSLLSMASLNSKGESIGQVGGVFTPNGLRQQGFSKAVMFHLLKDCRDLHGHTKSILFTGEENLAPQRLYESMGYQKIGYFALILSA